LAFHSLCSSHSFRKQLFSFDVRERFLSQFAGDPKSIEQIKALDLSHADFNVHFGVTAGGDEDVIDVRRGAELYEARNALAVAREGIGGVRSSTFSEVPYLEMRGATNTVVHEAPVVFYVNLKIVMKNIAELLVRWLK